MQTIIPLNIYSYQNFRVIASGINVSNEQEWITQHNSEVGHTTRVMNSNQAAFPRPPPTRRPHHGVVLAKDGALITTFICWVEPALVLAGIIANVCVIVGMFRLRDGAGVGRYVQFNLLAVLSLINVYKGMKM